MHNVNLDGHVPQGIEYWAALDGEVVRHVLRVVIPS